MSRGTTSGEIAAPDQTAASTSDGLPHRWAILCTVLVMTFMGCLDSSIVNVALPVMSRELGVDMSQIQWVASIYLVVNCASILVFGRLGDLIGKVRVFQAGVLLFTVGSLLCSLSHTLPTLIGARVVQSLGASAALANNQGIITEAFPARERGRSLGMVASFVALGTLTGPVLGGVIVGATSWEYIFVINVPVGLVAFLVGLRTLPDDSPAPAPAPASSDVSALHAEDGSGRKAGCGQLGAAPSPLRRLDVGGSILMAVALVLVFCSLTLLESASSPLVWGALVLGVVLFVAFVLYERRCPEPLVRMDVFRDVHFDVNLVTMLIVFVVFGANNMILPFYLQDARAFGVTLAGLLMASYPLVNFFVGPLAGSLSDRVGCEGITMAGLFVFGIGAVVVSLLGASTPIPVIAASLMLMSLGSSSFQSPNNALVMGSAPRDALGFVGSLSALVRSLGMSLGIVLSTSLLYNRMSDAAGYRVTSYVEGHAEYFLYGFRWVYLVLAVLVAVACALATWRFVASRRSHKADARTTPPGR